MLKKRKVNIKKINKETILLFLKRLIGRRIVTHHQESRKEES
jgi:hypothetical protein